MLSIFKRSPKFGLFSKNVKCRAELLLSTPQVLRSIECKIQRETMVDVWEHQKCFSQRARNWRVKDFNDVPVKYIPQSVSRSLTVARWPHKEAGCSEWSTPFIATVKSTTFRCKSTNCPINQHAYSSFGILRVCLSTVFLPCSPTGGIFFCKYWLIRVICKLLSFMMDFSL